MNKAIKDLDISLDLLEAFSLIYLIVSHHITISLILSKYLPKSFNFLLINL
ncbi:protein of unknown function [Tenacibaculum jejuense]|uniref:Uncharacterized protein n=1 Tax=Tenacibaculum jejuense TaxID=584609 RepID=A0A238UBV6_9FLAO|nr:protein of unknown function [Tenacibaculum jejuense]